MSSDLTTRDYINILKYYKIKIPQNKDVIKKKAEKLLNEKLCKCIKKVSPKDETKSIAICSKSIFTNRGLTRGRFSCLGKKTLNIKKNKKKKTMKKRKL
jgi:hypothetical protein